MDLSPPNAISPQPRGTDKRPTDTPPPKAADTAISGQAWAFTGVAGVAADEVMLAGELIAAAKALTGDGKGLSRSMVFIVAVADADRAG